MKLSKLNPITIFKDWKFNRRYKKAVEIAKTGKELTKKRHLVILTQDNRFQVVTREGLKQLNKALRGRKLAEYSYQEILKKALFDTL